MGIHPSLCPAVGPAAAARLERGRANARGMNRDRTVTQCNKSNNTNALTRNTGQQ